MLTLFSGFISGEIHSTVNLRTNEGSTYNLNVELNSTIWIYEENVFIYESIHVIDFGGDANDFHDITLYLVITDNVDFRLEFQSPGEGKITTKDNTYTVEWTTTPDNTWPDKLEIQIGSKFREEIPLGIDPTTDDRWIKVVDISVSATNGMTSPSITSPTDIPYELGSTGNTISWIGTDLDPRTYSYTVNAGTPSSSVAWTSGTPVLINVDGHPVGIYTYVITFTDRNGNSDSDTVIVTVMDTTPPVVSRLPADVSYQLGTTGHTISWTATDLDPGTYAYNVNGGILTSPHAWTSGTPVVIKVEGLTIGPYIYVITFTDASDNNASDTVIVTVTEDTTNLKPTTNTTDSESTITTTAEILTGTDGGETILGYTPNQWLVIGIISTGIIGILGLRNRKK